ncbi:MAG: hypothetical protein IKF41_01570 [Alphaproteobacteria bacterium]|nr:hypothetical protein [Alphaproteobacteria bacterium]
MKRFHRNLNIMSIFTAVLLAFAVVFWQTVFNIAITNIILNGIIIGTTLFGIGLCFLSMFGLLPEYKWLHAYFAGRADYGYTPKLLRPISMALHNRHIHITTNTMSELLDLVSIRIEDKRDSVRYITNTLIFLGLLGTFWGLIVTVGGFAELLMAIDFDDPELLQNMQIAMAGPLSGMATAFTSSLLGLAGSLVVGFLGLQLQFAQNTIFQELTDFMSQYVLQNPTNNINIAKVAESAPVSADTFTKISQIHDAFIDAKYVVRDLIRIDGKYPALVAIGSGEKMFIATLNNDADVLQNVLKRIELCFADTLEGVNINLKIICVSGKNIDLGDGITRFNNTNALHQYLMAHPNTLPKTKKDRQLFDAYSRYIGTAIDYLFKTNN